METFILIILTNLLNYKKLYVKKNIDSFYLNYCLLKFKNINLIIWIHLI